MSAIKANQVLNLDGDRIGSVVVDSIANMKNLNTEIEANATVEVLGYYSKGDGGGGTFYWDSTSIEDDNGGTIIEATGVTDGRWIRNYSGSVNVKWFGAVGDGVTDDTLAIQNAIYASSSVYLPDSIYVIGTMYYREPNYNINDDQLGGSSNWTYGTYSGLSISGNTKISGDNATLKLAGTSNETDRLNFIISNSRKGSLHYNVEISGVTFDLDTDNNFRARALMLIETAGVTISNCTFTSSTHSILGGYGVYLANCSNVMVDEATVFKFLSGGLHTIYSNKLTINCDMYKLNEAIDIDKVNININIDANFSHCGMSGEVIDINASKNVTVNSRFEKCKTIAVVNGKTDMAPNWADWLTRSNIGWQFSENISFDIEALDCGGIEYPGSRAITIGNTWEVNEHPDETCVRNISICGNMTDCSGIYIHEGTDVNIHDLTIHNAILPTTDASEYTAFIYGVSEVDATGSALGSDLSINISNVTVNDSNRSAIYLRSASYVSINNCSFNNFSLDASQTVSYRVGVLITSCEDRDTKCSINNTYIFSDTATYGLRLIGTGGTPHISLGSNNTILGTYSEYPFHLSGDIYSKIKSSIITANIGDRGALDNPQVPIAGFNRNGYLLSANVVNTVDIAQDLTDYSHIRSIVRTSSGAVLELIDILSTKDTAVTALAPISAEFESFEEYSHISDGDVFCIYKVNYGAGQPFTDMSITINYFPF
jgi:hypothetical protein